MYAEMPKGFLGFTTPDSKQWLDLPEWREMHGWDKNGTMADLQVNFNSETLELTMTNKQPLPAVSVFRHIDTDLFGKPTGETRLPGPFADAGNKSTWKLDPRSADAQLRMLV